MPDTPVYGLPYLAPSDPPDIASLGEDLADAVETELVRIDGELATSRFIAEHVRESSVGTFTTTETVIQAVSFTAVAAVRYRVTAFQAVQSSVANDLVRMMLKWEPDGSFGTGGTEVDHKWPNCDVANRGQQIILCATLVPGAGTTSVGVTAVRTSGTGNITCYADATNARATILVERY